MKSSLSILIILLLGACSSKQQVNLGPGNGDVYISSGVEQYFLGNLPFWANFSGAGKCFRKAPIKYLNFENISKSFNLSYEKMVHMQHMLNKKLFAYKTSTGQHQLSPRDEAYVFNNIYQQALGGSYEFSPPKFGKISLVWIDAFLSNPKKIKATLKRADVSEGYPILLSHCLSAYELEELAQDNELDELGVKYISAEMFNNYTDDIKATTNFSLNINLMLKNKTITLFAPTNSNELRGKYNFVQLK